jgi:hypothetical protein
MPARQRLEHASSSGVAEATAAIAKFKSGSSSTTSVPIGTPIALEVIAAILIFAPAILGM